MLLDDMADYLSTGGLGTPSKGFLPETPNAAFAVFETPGFPPVRGMSPAAGAMKCERPRLQVVARGDPYDYSTPRLLLHQVLKRLDGLGDLSINGCRYLWVGAVGSSPGMMGRDNTGRVKLVMNFDVVKELSTS